MAKLPGKIRVEDIPETAFEPAPEGWHTVAIQEANYVQSKNNKEAWMIVLKMVILSDVHQNGILFDRINIVNPNDKAEAIGVETLGKICMCLGIDEIDDTDQLLDGVLRVRVVHEEYQGKKQEKVRDYGPEEDFQRPKQEVVKKKAAPGAGRPATAAESAAEKRARLQAEMDALSENEFSDEPAQETTKRRPWQRG